LLRKRSSQKLRGSGSIKEATERGCAKFRVRGEYGTKEVTNKMKSGKRGKAEGALYKIAGRVLEAIGSLTGDRKKKAKGRLARGKGTAKDSVGRLKGLFKK
jgi:uncharacterized protein YjbJ (UPF0337 family)